ncbi:MAG TPA: presqualene diphosphate synthase HpnD [Vicinamibacterales bacterium]|jgi:phytoene synthase
MSRDTSFYYSFLVLPPNKRRAIIAVWDFCRAVDDAVDEVIPEHQWAGGLTADARARAALQIAGWRSELDAVYSGTPMMPQGVALQPHVREFNLPRVHFEELIEGVEMDLACARYDSFDALSEYCRRVASAVGLICVEIFGYQDARARAYAGSLGMALQLTNIIRDVAADLRRGRIYFPIEDLVRFGVTEADLSRTARTALVNEKVTALLRFECNRAREFYRRAASELPQVDAQSLVAAEIMGGIYYGILRRIERKRYDVFSARIRVPRPQRAVIALHIWIRALLGFKPLTIR